MVTEYATNTLVLMQSKGEGTNYQTETDTRQRQIKYRWFIRLRHIRQPNELAGCTTEYDDDESIIN